jgi:hypothetical protein
MSSAEEHNIGEVYQTGPNFTNANFLMQNDSNYSLFLAVYVMGRMNI